ncbi:hypothetical protein BBJ28_00026323 [Nothophytophthora sp. Chile5]|nr:hypothetical protein BBJ28_00026323 [Nothophytophthora sp. Chile5]
MACALVVNFVVPGGGLIVDALGLVLALCREMKEKEELCCHVHGRMKAYLSNLRKLTDDDEAMLRENKVLDQYGSTIAEVIQFLRLHKEKNLLRRLMTQRKVVARLQVFHEEIDELYRLLNVNHITEMQRWREKMSNDLREQEEKQEQRVQELLANQAEIVTSQHLLPDLLAGLKFELEFKAKENSEQQKKMMEAVLAKVSTSRRNIKIPDVSEWFISRDDVQFGESFFDEGCYSFIHRGTWGKGTSVVIKCLKDPNATEAFFKEADVWYRLDHPHIIKMYGGCNVNSGKENPAFFVCEEASNGNFMNYFEKDKSEIWRLFYEVAQGLHYLHAKKVVHGDLKCNNLLVGSDGRGKICDFGFSFVRENSKTLSIKDQADNVRWKAPECLLIATEDDAVAESEKPREDDAKALNPRFASDVYSLGMCLIEAFGGEPPFGVDMVDDDILDCLEDQKPYERVPGLQDDEWTLVQRMCMWDYKQRISLAAAIDDLKALADREAEMRATSLQIRPCFKCLKDVGVVDVFCRHCGVGLKADAVAA